MRPASLSDFLAHPDTAVEVAPAMDVGMRQPVMVNKAEGTFALQEPVGFPPIQQAFPASLPAPPMMAGRLRGAMCATGGVVVSRDGVVLDESFSSPFERTFHHALTCDAGTFSFKSEQRAERRLPGLTCCVDFMHLGHYGHILVDVLSRLWVIPWAMEVLGMRSLSVALPIGAPGFILEFLQALGVRADQIIRFDRAFVCEELLVSTRALQLHRYATPLSANVYGRIRDRIAKRLASPARIYLSRSGVGNRPLTNEAEVEAVFRERGFAIVRPETLAVDDQLTLFANARLVAGPSGSALFNLAFQRDLEAAFILVSPVLIHRTDVLLAACRESELAYFVGEPDTGHRAYDPSNVHAPWKVEAASLAEAVDTWLATYDPPDS